MPSPQGGTPARSQVISGRVPAVIYPQRLLTDGCERSMPRPTPVRRGWPIATTGPEEQLVGRTERVVVDPLSKDWVSSSEAHAEVQFDDGDPSMNEALLSALSTNRNTIENAFGSALDW